MADDDLRHRLERWFHWPMILLSLAVLPLLAIEVHQRPTGALEWWVDVGFGVIWVAFLIEFVIKITVAESRPEYVKRNWLDLVVILLPLLRFLRLTSLARTVRLLKLRGVAFKFARSAITVFVSLEIADRLLTRLGLRKADALSQPRPVSMTRAELIDEVVALRLRVDAWRRWYAAHRAFLEAQGVVTYGVRAPEGPPPERGLDPPGGAEAQEAVPVGSDG